MNDTGLEIDQKRAKWRSLLLVALAWCPGVLSGEEELKRVQKKVQSAIDEYQQAFGETNPSRRIVAFRKAEIAFSSLLDSPAAEDGSKIKFDANLYVSWGNAAIQAGNKGVSILAFRRALLVDPYHQQAQKNLDFVKSQLPQWTQNPRMEEVMISQLFFWNQWLGKPTRQLFSALAFMLACVLFAFSIRWSSAQLRWASVVPLLAWLVLVVSGSYDVKTQTANRVVFVSDEVQARSADSLNSPASFGASIPSGTEAAIIESRDEWTKVEFGDRKQGWVQNSSVRKIQ